jgi:diguanylate cyclase (GGDEF)-like protein
MYPQSGAAAQLTATDLDLGATTQILATDFLIPHRVLIVDDDDLVLARLEGLLLDEGFEVSTATSGAAAMQSMHDAFAPIVITDLKMPEMSGLAVCRALRQQSWPGYVYVLLLTVQDDQSSILAGLAAGADDYLSKSMPPEHLLARLRTGVRILTLERSLKTALADKRRLALTDELTGAPNRRYFRKRLSREIDRVSRLDADLSLLSLDIDHFKQINDRFGHSAGDTVLQEFARRITLCLPRQSDWCARVGGQEFFVVLEETTLAGAAFVAERIQSAIANSPVDTRAGAIDLSVSIGVSGLEAVDHRGGITLDTLLDHTNRQLTMSKQRGRNRVTTPRSLRAVPRSQVG